MKLYIANTTKQRHDFAWRKPETGRLVYHPINAGSQAVVIDGNGSVIQQILPTFYVNRLQQQFSKYFSSLQIALADVDPPVYNISAITNSGSKIVAQVYV
ncbi:hypothetical protein IB600_000020 [Salmonella enterica]|nr:hypothetical protein [Salmonella enterica]EGF2369571.1 hypothetical protein [Salmonella enterica]